jgi:prevent-host-death family protein
MASNIRPARDLRNNYPEVAAFVKNQSNHVVITNRGRGDLVLIDYEDYQEYELYLHQKFIAEKLKEAEERANDPDAKWYSLDETMAALRKRPGCATE